nr:MAG TPA: hypothetical protein [Caudoviricetes sp.]
MGIPDLPHSIFCFSLNLAVSGIPILILFIYWFYSNHFASK